MANRSIDYYVKNLGIDARQQIFNMLREVNPSIVKKLLEKEDGYTSWKNMGYDEESITIMLTKSSTRFSEINKVMIENQRPPLFVKPSDTYDSAQKYVELLKEKTEEELNKEFGCSWEEYVPETYQKEESNDAPDLE